jgi:Zn ribbon nucleic-acid-binding protein
MGEGQEYIMVSEKDCPNCGQTMLNHWADEGDRSFIRGRECTACGHKEGDV